MIVGSGRPVGPNGPQVSTDLLAIRTALLDGRAPDPIHFADSHQLPLLHELETTVSMIPVAFTDSLSNVVYSRGAETGDPPLSLFVPDALSNPEHLKFALRGCLAATLCYIFYEAKDWPGINTAITTCFLTALSTVGSSRQKQVLRIAGAIIGVVLGIGAQIFILSNLDSIAGFTLLFLAVTIPATWIATSGPRLSYCGVQIIVALYLINLSDFAVQTSLEPGRDRVIGIFLGLLVMWLVFDQLWSVPAVVEMKKQFVASLRLLAQFAREPISPDLRTSAERSFALREKISNSFNAVRASADGVLLEFGASRERDLVWRNRIRNWQPQLRILFLIRIALWKYRAQLPGFDLPPAVNATQKALDEDSAKLLECLADDIDGKTGQQKLDLHQSFERLQHTVQTLRLEQPYTSRGSQIDTLLRLSTSLTALITSLTVNSTIEAVSNPQPNPQNAMS